VRADDDVRAGARAGPLANDVAFGVGADVLQSGLAQHRGVQLRALRFLEWRRFHFTDANLIVYRPQLVGFREVDSRPNRGCLKQRRSEVGRALLSMGGVQKSGESEESGCADENRPGHVNTQVLHSR
jgi:hypothetical protein